MKLNELKTVDIEVKEWRDRTYGDVIGTYASARAKLNCGMADAETVFVEFQHGDASHLEWVAWDAILAHIGEDRPRYFAAWSFCAENGIIHRRTHCDRGLMRDAESFGRPA